MVAVRVLGPIDVVRDGQRASVGGAVAKAVLSVLLTKGGLTISADRLVDDVWREGAKPSTKHTLQAHISNLRKVLGRSSIIGEGGGYRIDLDAIRLDVSDFERLSSLGDERLRLGDAGGAAELLTAALDLWRGPPYADVEHLDALRQEIERLEELQLHTQESRARARAEPDPEAALPELKALFERHPDRESLAALLMVTLYRTNRQSEALAVFQQLRNRLQEVRGIEPCPALQDLEIAILNQDPTLDRSIGSLRTNLDRTPPKLIGRDAEIHQVLGVLRAGDNIALTGPGGIGKSALARAVAAELIDEFSGGVWWVDLEAATDPGLGLQTIASALRLPTEAEIRPSLHRRFETFPSLLVLDGLDPPLNVDAETIGWLWAQPVTLLATSRTSQGWSGSAFALGPLPVPSGASDPDRLAELAAVKLFVERARTAMPGADVYAEPHLLADAVAATGGVPLEIELAAARLRATDLASIVGRTAGDIPRVSGDIAESDREALVLLSGIPGTFGNGVAHALLGNDRVASLPRLEEAGVVHIIPALAGLAHYRIVDSVRVGAGALLDAEPLRSTFDERILAWATGRTDETGREPETEQPAFRAALSRATQLERWDELTRILARLAPVWINLHGWLAEALVWLRRAASAPSSDPQAEVDVRLLHARAAHRSGEYAEAIEAATLALEVATHHHLEPARARALLELGHSYQFAGWDPHAEFEAGRAAAAAVGDLDTVARADLLIAQTDLLNGTADGTTPKLLSEAAEIFRDAADLSSAAHATVMLAAYMHFAGRPEVAAELADEAVDLAERGSDRSVEILGLYRLASIEEQLGWLARSRRTARRGLRAALEVGHRALVAELLLVFAAIELDESNRARATEALAAHTAMRNELGLVPNALDQAFLERLRRELGPIEAGEVDAFATARSLIT